jgi:hypothetical protein
MLNLKDYPYGKPTKALINAVAWLKANRRELLKAKSKDSFDYPDYWSMPTYISYRLLGDEVDWLQEELSEWECEGGEEEIYDALVAVCDHNEEKAYKLFKQVQKFTGRTFLYDKRADKRNQEAKIISNIRAKLTGQELALLKKIKGK